MSKNSLALSLLFAFVLGCAAAQLVVPRVRAGTNPTRWEYACTPDVREFKKLGAEGW